MGLENDRLGPAELAVIRDQHVGSVWFTTRTSVGVAGVRGITDAVQAQATATATGGVGFFIAANQEGGLIQALQGPGFDRIPSALEQGALDPVVLKTRAARWGRQLAAAGINLNFAPVLDVVSRGRETTNEPIGVLKRGFGPDPSAVGAHGTAFIEGMAQAQVATTAKHFPGLGRVVGNTDETADVVDDETTRNDPYLAPFSAAIDDDVPFVMVALATYERVDPDHLAAFSPAVIQDLLRDDLGFDGVVMSDDLGATEAVADIPAGRRAVDFLAAGGDLVISKTAEATVAMTAAVRDRVQVDSTFAAAIDESARRVVEAKTLFGLVDCPG
jgi:beta-N-acetylhexosaminidase